MEWQAAAGATLRAIARSHGVPYDALWRHWSHHVSVQRKATLLAGPQKLASLVDAAADEGRSVLDHLKILRATLYDSLTAASEAGDRNSVAHLSGRALDVLREFGRITGELVEAGAAVQVQQTNNYFFASPQFHQLESTLLGALARFPDARAAVVRALRGLDTGAPAAIELPAIPASRVIEGAAGAAT